MLKDTDYCQFVVMYYSPTIVVFNSWSKKLLNMWYLMKFKEFVLVITLLIWRFSYMYVVE